MDGKKIFEWGLILVALFVIWRLATGFVSGLASSNSGGNSASTEGVGELGPTIWLPNYYTPGVYGPWNPNGGWGPSGVMPPGWPYYDSPAGPPGPWNGTGRRPIPY